MIMMMLLAMILMMMMMQLTPNITWPDVVYYNSYTTPYMGWKIHIVDNFRQKPRRPGFGSASLSRPAAGSLIIGLVISTWAV